MAAASYSAASPAAAHSPPSIPSSLGAAQQALRSAPEALAINYAGVLAGQVEAVHQFRISTRRLRAALEIFRPLLHRRWFKHYRGELRLLADAVGAIRDCDVAWRTIRVASADLEPQLRQALASIHHALADQRRQQHQKACALLRSRRYEALARRVPTPFKRLALSPSHLSPRLIQPVMHKVVRAGARLAPHSPLSDFHRLRIKVKRLRYALEMLPGVESTGVNKLLKRLKTLQGILGLQHDCVAAITWLHQFSTCEGLSSQTLLTAGALLQALHRRRNKRTRQAWNKWKSLHRSAIIEETVSRLAREGTVWAVAETNRYG